MNKFLIITFLVFLYSSAWCQNETDGELSKNDKRRYEVGNIFLENSGEECSFDVDKAERFYSETQSFVLAPNILKKGQNEFLDETDIKMGVYATFFSFDELKMNAMTTIENQFNEKKLMNETVDEVSFKLNY